MKPERLTAAILILAAGASRGVCQTSINPTQSRVGVPAANRPVNCSAGQMWLASDTGVLSYCSGVPGTWKTLTSAGTGSGSDSLCPVALSASPVFDASQCGAFQLTLGETAVTSASLANARAGQELTFLISQDAAGGRTFVWPESVANACAISSAPGVTTIVSAIYDGTTANTTYCTTTDEGTLITGPTRSAPGTPADGLSCWFDALTTGGGTWKCKDTSGNVRAAVQTAAGATANQVAKYIDADGLVQTGPVAEQELGLSDVTTANATTTAHGFLPKLPGDNTKCLLGDGTYGSCGTGGGGAGATITGGGAFSLTIGTSSALGIPAYGPSASMDAYNSAGKMSCVQIPILWAALHLGKLMTVSGGNGLATDVFAAAIYSDAGNAVGTKVTGSDVAIVGADTVSYKTPVWGNQPTLSPGVYWRCWSGSGSSIYWKTDGLDSSVLYNLTVGAGTTPARYVRCADSVTYNGASTTLPNTCTSPVAHNFGMIPYMVVLP